MKPDTSPEAVAASVRMLREYYYIPNFNRCDTADLLEAVTAERDELRARLNERAKIANVLLDEGHRAGLEEAAKWHDQEAARIRAMPKGMSETLRSRVIDNHEDAATAIRALAAPQKECPMMIADQLAAALKTISEVKREAAKERRILLALIADISDALTDEGPAWSTEGLEDMRRRSANALPPDMCPDWLIRYALVEKGYQK